ncbi:hypothetical protein [Streptomyces profundus]|uniref:hypothetical protein n=1 Tax=Streptomyces profundus TaxID=2867410 RepID=UPI001D1622D6|nr:hypothetical protein [Streptomyces sp. MA3_2.13]UED88084.1 hypothetical protein K4G22_30990 [Streptomyces sp. MA3_2.13]
MTRITLPTAVTSARRPRHLHLVKSGPGWLDGDVVEVPEEHGRRVLAGLPRPGAIFGIGPSWWWSVPPGSQTGLHWPEPVRYLTDVRLPVTATPEWAGEGLWTPQLVHWPGHGAPYTHPLLLFIALCRLAGVDPVSTGAADLTAN